MLQGLLLLLVMPASAADEIMEEDIAAPPALSITNGIAGDLFNVTVGGPTMCMCESPACIEGGAQLLGSDVQTFRARERCNSYSIGGTITSSEDGAVCYTFRADYKSCVVYPSDAYTSGFTTAGAAACSRLIGASCTLSRSVAPGGQWKEYPVLVTLTGSVDTVCNTLPWQSCDTEAGSVCCAGTAGWTCQRVDPDRYEAEGYKAASCQPPHGPGWGSDSRVFRAMGAKGDQRFS